jgi:hypothetical protein
MFSQKYTRIAHLSLLLNGFCFIGAAVVLLDSCSKDTPDPVIEAIDEVQINELYSSTGEDWIELYNGGDKEKNIGGYHIYDNVKEKYAIPASTIIPAKGFLVLICDNTATGLHTNFKLSSLGETVYLENNSGRIVDKAQYASLTSGQSYGRFPDGTGAFSISGAPTRGTSNGDTQAPLIEQVSRNKLVPGLNDNVIVQALVSSSSPLSSVTLHYQVNSGLFSEVAMVKNQSLYEATIPALNDSGEIHYYISAKNSGNNESVNPVDAPAELYSYLLNDDVLPPLKINEFLASNTTCCPDHQNNLDEFDDWIEIYNSGNTAIDLGGMYVSDDISNPFKYRIPKTNPGITTIQPKGFLLIWADESGTQGELHANFKLSGTGEEIGLFYEDGRTIDTHEFGIQAEDVSMGLSPDGGNIWKSFATPTPGASNN